MVRRASLGKKPANLIVVDGRGGETYFRKGGPPLNGVGGEYPTLQMASTIGNKKSLSKRKPFLPGGMVQYSSGEREKKKEYG